MVGELGVKLGEWLRVSCGGTVGCTEKVSERELWNDSWMYKAMPERE